MKKITYNGETYQPSQFWPLVRALTKCGWQIDVLAWRGESSYPYRINAWVADKRGIETITDINEKTPFLALGMLVDEIKKQEAAK